MRKPLLLGVFTLLFLVGTLAASAQPPADLLASASGPRIVPGRYIVVLQDGADAPATARRLQAAHGLRLLSVYQHALKGFAAVIPEARVELLRQDPSVVSIEPDREIYAVSQFLPTGVNRIDADLNALAGLGHRQIETFLEERTHSPWPADRGDLGLKSCCQAGLRVLKSPLCKLRVGEAVGHL